MWFFFFFLVLNSLDWLQISMVLKLIPISTVLIGRFQHHKALDEYNNCNFSFTLFMLRIYLSNHNAEKFLLTGNKSVNLNTIYFLFRPFQKY